MSRAIAASLGLQVFFKPVWPEQHLRIVVFLFDKHATRSKLRPPEMNATARACFRHVSTMLRHLWSQCQVSPNAKITGWYRMVRLTDTTCLSLTELSDPATTGNNPTADSQDLQMDKTYHWMCSLQEQVASLILARTSVAHTYADGH